VVFIRHGGGVRAHSFVARLLGAKSVGAGVAISENQIAIERGMILAVAGPPLQPGRRVGWSVRPERVRLNAKGRYEAQIESITTIGGAREIQVRLGGTPMLVLADPYEAAPANVCRLDIDPGTVQVWPLEPADTSVACSSE
jgi:ABC-type Fe3+/spermidine/putrescine transport system ATPase subunit